MKNADQIRTQLALLEKLHGVYLIIPPPAFVPFLSQPLPCKSKVNTHMCGSSPTHDCQWCAHVTTGELWYCLKTEEESWQK